MSKGNRCQLLGAVVELALNCSGRLSLLLPCFLIVIATLGSSAMKRKGYNIRKDQLKIKLMILSEEVRINIPK